MKKAIFLFTYLFYVTIEDPNRPDLRICCCTHVNQTVTERPQSRKIATDSSDSIMEEWWIWVVIGAAVCCWCCLCAFIIFACSKEEEKTFTKGHDDGLEYGGDLIMGVDEDSGPASGDVVTQNFFFHMTLGQKVCVWKSKKKSEKIVQCTGSAVVSSKKVSIEDFLSFLKVSPIFLEISDETISL